MCYTAAARRSPRDAAVPAAVPRRHGQTLAAQPGNQLLLLSLVSSDAPYFRFRFIIDRVAVAIIYMFGSVRVSVRLSVGALLFEPFDHDFWHEGRP